MIKVEEKIVDYEYCLSGSTVESRELANIVVNDMLVIMIVAVIIVILILLLNSISWIEPLIFAIVSGTAILINMGTNSLLPSVSFVTKSICAVMQLALAMDYSIILLHKFMEEKDRHPELDNNEVMKKSLSGTIIPILGSSLTTIAGLFALVCMTLTLGADMGIVLAKGIFISLLSVFLFMPGVILCFSKAIVKTKHRSVYQIFRTKFSNFESNIAKYQIKTKFVIVGLLVIIIPVSFVLYSKASYGFDVSVSLSEESKINQDAKAIQDTFGVKNTLAILVPKGDLEKESKLVEVLKNYEYKNEKMFDSIQSISTIGIYNEYTYKELSSLYHLDESLVKNVFEEIKQNTLDLNKKNQDISTVKFELNEVLTYLKDNDYINKYASSLQEIFDSLYKQTELLDKVITPEGIVEYINNDYLELSNINYLLTKIPNSQNMTYKELINYLNDNQVINSIYRQYGEYKSICEKIKNENKYSVSDITSIFDLSENESSKIIINEMTIKEFLTVNKDKVSDLDEVSKTTFKRYEEVLETYNIPLTFNELKSYSLFDYKLIPSSIFKLIFNNKSSLTNYDIQTSLSSFLISYEINQINEQISSLANDIAKLDKVYSKGMIVTDFGLPEAYEDDILNGKNMTGLEVLTVIYDKQLLITIGNELSLKLNEVFGKLAYALKMFESEHYSRIVCNLPYSKSSDEAIYVSDKDGIKKEVSQFYDDYYVISESLSYIDFRDTFSIDSLKINLISFVFIFLIIMISFKSITIPFLLTLIIEGSIWITMATNYLADKSAYFICYLLVVSIQMGVTIDYAILYTNKYVESRKRFTVYESIQRAFKEAIPTILTSGSILVIAAFLVYKFSKLSIISEIGFLLSKGSLISIIFILTTLPQLLIVFDKIIQRTSYKYKFVNDK